MPIDTSIYSLIKPVQVDTPSEIAARQMSLAQLGQQRQLNDLKIQDAQMRAQEAQLEQQEQSAIQQAYGEVGGDITKLPEVLAGKVRSDTVLKLQKSINDTIKSRADMDESRLKADTLKRDRLRGIYSEAASNITPDMTPELAQPIYASAIQRAVAEQLVDPSEVPIQYPGYQAFQLMGHGLVTGTIVDKLAEEARKAKLEAADAARKQAEHDATLPGKAADSQSKVRSSWAAQLGAATSPQQYNSILMQIPRGIQVPSLEEVFDAEGKILPGAMDAVRRVGMTAEQQATAAQNAKPNSPAELALVKTDPNAPPELRQHATDALTALAAYNKSGSAVNPDLARDAIETAAQSLSQGDLTRLRDIASLRGDQRLLIYARARQLNPKFSTGEIDRKIKMQDYIDNGKGADAIQSFGTFLEHAGTASDAINGLSLFKSKYANKPMNWWRENMSGSKEYQKLMADLEPVRKEFESFLLGGRALYAEDRMSAEKILNDNNSPDQIRTALTELGHTAQARFNELNYRYKRLMGKDIEDPFTPEAIAAASKLGVKLLVAEPKAEPEAQAPATVREQRRGDEYRYTTDGGKTWNPGRAPKQAAPTPKPAAKSVVKWTRDANGNPVPVR